MNVTIEINCDNAAFDDIPHCELSRILSYIADNVKVGYYTTEPGEVKTVRDVNGNDVGVYKVTGA